MAATVAELVVLDAAEAVRWFRRAAEQGHADAQNSLGLIYKVGIKSRGVEVTRMEPVADTWAALVGEDAGDRAPGAGNAGGSAQAE